MKLTLCMVILLSMSAAGIWIGSAFRARERLIAQLVRELRLLEEQVRIGRPLQQALQSEGMEIFGRLASKIEDAGLQRAWREACEAAAGTDILASAEQPERRVLERFWAEAGTLDMHSQSDRFAEALRVLAGIQAQASEEAARRSRLYASLGLLLGLAVVILLW